MSARALLVGVAMAALGLAIACRGTLLTHFDHRAHLADRPCGQAGQGECLTCTSCHRPSPHEDEALAAPTSQQCAGCHRDAQAKLTHSTRGPGAALPAGKQIIFSHPAHVGLPELKGQCVKCHAGAVGFQSGSPLFPPMQTCLSCHRHREQFERNDCAGCHRRDDLRRLTPTSFLNHELDWLRRHGDKARTDEALCSTCHAQSQCDSCHESSRHWGPAQINPEAINRSFVHRFDFLGRHAIEAQSQPGACVTCHVRNECDSCHASRGLSASVRGAQSPHPPGWASGVSSNAHGPAARRDIASCAACHDQGPASNCVTCHRVGAYGGNPHPIGWRSTDSLAAPQCAACHGATP